MKIMMIGNKESGKTTYMASAFGLLENGQNGFYLKTDASSNQWFKKLYHAIEQGQYPNPSDKRDRHQFELYHHQKKILDFEWVDYYGGVITESSATTLTEDIESADGMILFFETPALLENKPSLHQFRRILSLITKKLTEIDGGLFSVIIVITKTDMVPAGTLLEELSAPFRTFIESVENHDHIYTRVVPVSCTSKGFFNVELPLLDILDSGMKIAYLTAALQAKEYAESYQSYNNQRGVFDWVFSRLFGAATNGELAQGYLAQAREQIALFESIEEPTKRLAEYVAEYTIRLPWEQEAQAPVKKRTADSQRLIEL